MPRLPHEVWESYGREFTPEEAYDFDCAVLDFADWFDNMSSQEKIVKDTSLKPKKGQAIGPKYESVGDILKHYVPGSSTPTYVVPSSLASIATSRDELDATMDDVMDAFVDSLGDDWL